MDGRPRGARARARSERRPRRGLRGARRDLGAASARRALEAGGAVLEAGGAGPEHIAHMTWYVTDIAAYQAAGRESGAAYKETFGRHFPSMTMGSP